MKKLFQNAAADIPAGVVVFLVALPLCLGVALGSNAPLISGIIAGICGGMVIGLLSGSNLSVSGPSPGYTAIVAVAVMKLPVFEAFTLAVALAGLIQIGLGFLRAGVLGDYVPNSVIRGMLSAIGVILILKQFPHLVGYDPDFSGDEAFIQSDGKNTFSELLYSLNVLTPAAVLIGVVSVGVLLLWDRPFVKNNPILRYVPGPLLVVITGVLMASVLKGSGPRWGLSASQYVQLPVAKDLKAFASFFRLPDWHYLTHPTVWTTAVSVALVVSLESLLSIEAIDKLDPYNRSTPTNRELKAQGIGNLVSGMLGGLPIASVIVRSSANLNAGAKTRLSTITHGMLLLASVLFIPGLLNAIPLSALAAILIVTGYKLAKPTLFREFRRRGWDQFVPFVATIGAILLTDLLVGIVIGIGVALFFLIRSNFHSAVVIVHDEHKYLVRLRKDVSFLNKPILKEKLESVPAHSFVSIDLTRADFIDKDVIDVINEFTHHAQLKDIRVEIRKSPNKVMHREIELGTAAGAA